ncbi:MAG: histidine kinase [Lacibacter sp.]
MKHPAVIFLLLVCSAAMSQRHHPAGVANTYTLGDADGFPGYNYTNLFYQVPSGKIYARDFFGNFHITGNNFIKQVAGFPLSVSYLNHITPSNGELWIYNSANVFVIRNDSLFKTVAFPAFKYITSYSIDGRQLFLFRYIKGNVEIYEFEDYSWIKKNTVKWDGDERSFAEATSFSISKRYCLVTNEPESKFAWHFFDTVNYAFEKKIITSIDVLNNEQSFKDYFLTKKGKENTSLVNSFRNFISARTGKHTGEDNLAWYHGGHLRGGLFKNVFVYQDNKGLYEYGEFDSLEVKSETVLFESNDILNGTYRNIYYPFLTVSMGNKPIRVFSFIKKYARLFKNEQSNNIFALGQDEAGRIWAGSYQSNLTILTPSQKKDKGVDDYSDKAFELPRQKFPFMNASLNYHGKMYFVGESMQGGVLRYDMHGKMTKVNPSTPVGYYFYHSPKGDQVYMPSAEGYDNPVYYCNASDLDKPYINWKKMAQKEGIAGFGMTTITEDTMGRIWMGHPKKGFAVYDPSTKKGKSFDARLNESPIGFISCLTDKKGTVWMGSDDKGLWYYNDYTKQPVPKNLHHIDHPLLNNVKRITSMTVYKNWLVLGCYNRVCLLNLDSFYANKRIIVRYLNPQEAAFSSFTEQNTMLVSKTDSTLWFSTSDMLYQWDINEWLHLPLYKVNVTTYLQKDSNSITLSPDKTIKLDAGINSFDMVFEYLSPDCLPRFTRTALIKEGDSIIYSLPGVQSRNTFKNLNNGAYVFYLDVFEQDGSTSHYKYRFVISKYFWQQWWFWVLLSLSILLPLILWLNALRKKANQQKQISYLNVVTLSNQFRPHFILNALNTIGADLKDKPAAETVISRLGESIDLIFNQSLKNKVSHSLQNEWSLVKNVIEIHRVMYLPELQVNLPSAEWLNQYHIYEIPVGILEIVVENALLHGLRNRKTAPYILTINTEGSSDYIVFKIMDNGIGRENAASLSSHLHHGRGTKNLFEIISILNRFNSLKIDIVYHDKSNNMNDGQGTEVVITIPKTYHYEY